MHTLTEDIIDPKAAHSLYGLFRERVRRSPEAEAYRSFDSRTGIWNSCTWTETDREVQRWRTALRSEDLQPGDRVAIWICNCREWVIMDQAALGMGLVVVPLFCNDRAENVSYILNDAEVKLLLIDNDGYWRALAAVPDQPESLNRVITMHRFADAPDDPRIQYVTDWLPETGEEIPEPSVNSEALATIVYTSGTTGHPKGVELSHRNILWNTRSGLYNVPVYREDIFLSFLPLSHMFERTVGYYIPVMTGAAVAFSRSITQLPEDFLDVRPTVLVSVPRIFERVRAKINEELERKPEIVRRLFQYTANIGWQVFEHGQGRGPWNVSFLLWPLLDRLVAKKIRDKFGGRLRTIVVGGAPLPPSVARLFLGIGLPLLQGYGMTEAAPVISVNMHHDNIPHSVGLPYRDLEIRIGDNEELLVRSPGVMIGYLNNAEATAEAVSTDGWLHTGDKADMEQGHIVITGRIKEIIVLANGEKVPPHDIEMAVDTDPLIDQVMIIGEGRPYLAALVVLHAALLQRLLVQLGLKSDDPEAMKNPGLEKLVLERIAARMHEFPGYAKVRRAALFTEPWSIEGELITPTLKLRRKKILERFGEDVHRLYEGHEL